MTQNDNFISLVKTVGEVGQRSREQVVERCQLALVIFSIERYSFYIVLLPFGKASRSFECIFFSKECHSTGS